MKIPFDAKLLELFASLVLVSVWVVTAYFYVSLPEHILGHFDLRGRVDRISSKDSVWLVPFVGTCLFTMLVTALRIDLRHYNYPFKIRPAFAARVSARAQTSIAFLNVVSMTVIVLLQLTIISLALQKSATSFAVSLWLAVGAGGIATLAYLADLSRYRAQSKNRSAFSSDGWRRFSRRVTHMAMELSWRNERL